MVRTAWTVRAALGPPHHGHGRGPKVMVKVKVRASLWSSSRLAWGRGGEKEMRILGDSSR